jgi:Uma2 family endonuclease
MSTVDAPRMTVEEFLALPDDGVERMLIDGVVRELGMTVRNWQHSAILMKLGMWLNLWLKDRPEPHGRVVGGEAGFRLSSGTLVGIDAAYASPELAVATPEGQAIFEGSPTLAIEILSPSDKQKDIDDKVASYLASDVPHVWVIQPRSRTITAYHPGVEPRFFTASQQIDAEPHLPGFRMPVASLFED